jgi:lysyl-tRNA synthetase class 2
MGGNFISADDIYAKVGSLPLVKDVSEASDIYTLKGRVFQINNLGKILFIFIKRDDKLSQIFIDVKCSSFDLAKELKVGDIISVEGWIARTTQGKTCLKAQSIKILTKALKIPKKPLQEGSEIADVEVLRRNRHLDILYNGAEVWRNRSSIVQVFREILNTLNFVEVETNVLVNTIGGASAKPFVTQYEALNEQVKLRIAPELQLKKLVIGGMDRVYEIGKNFRNEGLSNRHNPEFTSLEAYSSYDTYIEGMELVETLIRSAFTIVGKRSKDFSYKTMEELVKEQVGEVPYEKLNDVFEEKIADSLDNVFVTRHPVYTSPLAKICDDDPRFVERFELYMKGMEIANGFSELTDAVEQRKRFEAQLKDKDPMDIDEEFLSALEYGLPPTSGWGIGVDRLVMAALDKAHIKDVILFPQYRKRD